MNIKKILNILGYLVAAIMTYFITTKWFPNPVDISTNDSTSIVLDSIYKDLISEHINTIDSLQIALDKKPKLEIRYIPKPYPVIVKKDSIIVRDSLIYKETKEIITKKIEVKIPSLTPNPTNILYGDVSMILGKNNTTILKINKKYFNEGDILYLYDGEKTDTYLSAYYDKSTLKKRNKLNTSAVYTLLVSTKDDAEDRLDKLIKNKNKL